MVNQVRVLMSEGGAVAVLEAAAALLLERVKSDDLAANPQAKMNYRKAVYFLMDAANEVAKAEGA